MLHLRPVSSYPVSCLNHHVIEKGKLPRSVMLPFSNFASDVICNNGCLLPGVSKDGMVDGMRV